MHRFGWVAVLALSLMLLPTASASYPSEPEGDWYLLDQGGVLTDGQERAMSERLAEVEASTGTLVRVVTITRMIDFGLEADVEYFDEDTGYARGMYDYYGMEGDENKTILIALSAQDRRFKFVMPGHSETAQIMSQVVFDEDVAPHLRGNNWNTGLKAAIDGIEPYASDEVSTVPKPVFWGMLAMAVLAVPLVVRKAKNDFKSANYDGDKSLFAYSRLWKESLVARGMATFEAMVGEEDSKAKWEHLGDVKAIQECDLIEQIGTSTEIRTGVLRMDKRAEVYNIPEDFPLEYDGLDDDIAAINNHIKAPSFFSFIAFVQPCYVFIGALFVFNFFLKNDNLGFDVVLMDFNSFNGLYMILIPLLLAGILTVALALSPSFRVVSSIGSAGSSVSNEYVEVYSQIPAIDQPISATRNAAGGLVVPGFLGTIGAMSTSGYIIESTGRDEYGNETFEVYRDYTDHGSDSGSHGGGGGCGGGGCGGGGCGGGGGF